MNQLRILRERLRVPAYIVSELTGVRSGSLARAEAEPGTYRVSPELTARVREVLERLARLRRAFPYLDLAHLETVRTFLELLDRGELPTSIAPLDDVGASTSEPSSPPFTR